MIVGAAFQGDNDLHLRREQQVCYGEMLGVIAYGCIRHFEAALRILGKDEPELAEKINKIRKGFDHKLLQPIHDLASGYWRWTAQRHEPYITGLEPSTINDWKTWLVREVDQWALYAPEIIRYVILLLFEGAGKEGHNPALEALKYRYREMASL